MARYGGVRKGGMLERVNGRRWKQQGCSRLGKDERKGERKRERQEASFAKEWCMIYPCHALRLRDFQPLHLRERCAVASHSYELMVTLLVKMALMYPLSRPQISIPHRIRYTCEPILIESNRSTEPLRFFLCISGHRMISFRSRIFESSRSRVH